MRTREAGREAGRSLDAEVAERVMGWSWRHSCVAPVGDERIRSNGMCWKWLASHSPLDKNMTGKEEVFLGNLPRYSTDVAAAFEVVEAMRAKGWTFTIIQYVSGRIDVECENLETGLAAPVWGANTVPLGICLAALEALDAETKSAAERSSEPSASLPSDLTPNTPTTQECQ